MNEDIKKILRTIKYCAGDYMKQEEGVQYFEWSDLWVLNEYIEQLQNNWNELKKWLESKGTSTKEENDALCYFYTYKKMQELQGDDKN